MIVRPPDILQTTLSSTLERRPATAARSQADRLREAAERGMGMILRQSTHQQVKMNLASAPTQDLSRQCVKPYGLDPERVERISALGESGQPWADRPVFERTLARIRAGELGVIILPLHSRLGRNDVDSFRLIQALADRDGFMFAEGTLYDLADPVMKSALKTQAIFSQQQIEQFTAFNIATKLLLAMRRAFRIPLPPPLIWVPWYDEEYLSRLEAAGHGAWREQYEAIPVELRAKSTYVERETLAQIEFVPGPFPDRDVIRSAELRMRWLLETGSATEVERRIGSNPDWPRPGLVPMFSKRRWSSSLTVEWTPVGRSGLHHWLGLPTNFGIYTYTSRRSKRMPFRQRSKMTPSVWAPDAFPAWASPDDYERAREILAAGPRPKAKHREARERHLVKHARCSHPLRNGRVCGHKLSPFVMKRTLEYRGSGCGFSDYRFSHPDRHATNIGADLLEGAVMRAVERVVRPELIEEGIDAFRLNADAALSEHRRLDAQIGELEHQLDAAGRSADQHERHGNAKLAARARGREEELQNALDKLEAERATLGSEEDVRTLTKRELSAIRSLAINVPAILAAAPQHPGAVREFLWTCVSAIWVRRIAVSTYEVDVEFPSGMTVRQVVRTRDLTSTQPQRAWAAARLAAGVSAESVAAELNAANVRTVRVLFTADRARAAAEQFHLENRP